MKRGLQIRGLIRRQGPLLALMLWMLVVLLLQAAWGPAWYYRFMVVPANIVEHWQALREGDSGVSWRGFLPLLTSAFLHGGFSHWLFNMLLLWIFAALVAELLGSGWMLGIFAITAVAGSICHVAMNAGETTPMLGASGAVMGFEGVYLGLAMRWHLPDPHVWPMARPVSPGQLAALGVAGVMMDLMGIVEGTGGIAYGAHIGGFVGGVLLSLAVLPKPKQAWAR